MRTRNLIFLILSLSFLLGAGLLAMAYRIGFPFDPSYFHRPGWDCNKTPDARPCLIEEATTIARQIEEPAARAALFVRIIRTKNAVTPFRMPGSDVWQYMHYPAVPSFDEAIEAATMTEGPDRRIMAMVLVAALMTESGHERGPRLFESLVWLVQEEGLVDPLSAMRLGPESAKSETLLRIARAQATAGDLVGAQQTAARQSTGLWRVKTLAEIAETLAVRGDKTAAQEFASEAVTAMRNLPDRDAADAVTAETAGVLARTGQLKDALAMAAGPRDVGHRAFAYLSVARSLAEAGRLAEAEEAISRIELSSARGHALRGLATARARAGDISGARALLTDIGEPLPRQQAIADIAGFEAKAGDLEGALDDIADLPAGFTRDRGLRHVLESLIDSGRLAEAEDILAGLAGDALHRGLTVKMAAARAQAGRIDAALALARAAHEPETRVEALLTVAEGMAAK